MNQQASELEADPNRGALEDKEVNEHRIRDLKRYARCWIVGSRKVGDEPALLLHKSEMRAKFALCR